MHNTTEPAYDDVTDASQLLSGESKGGSPPICQITVQPKDQNRVQLGEFDKGDKLKGFSVELTPDPDPANSIVTRITSIESADKRKKLILHVANYGTRAINVSVRRV